MSWKGPRKVGEPSPPYKGSGKKLTKKGKEIRDRIKEKNHSKISFRKSSSIEFKKAIDALPKKDKFFITDYTIEDYKKMKTFLFKSSFGKGYAGYAIKNGELVSVFNSSKIKGAGRAGVKDAVKRKLVNRLDCYGERLKSIYGKEGFIVESSSPFNSEYVNEYWNEKEHNHPNYLVMRLSAKKVKYLERMKKKYPTKYQKI